MKDIPNISDHILNRGNLMAIVEEPDPRLHVKSQDVQEVNEEVRQLMANMVKIVVTNEGLGLAAVQVGVMKNVLVVDASLCCQYEDAKEYIPEEPYLCMANPEIIELSNEKSGCEEHCFSYPGLGVPIERPKWAKIRYLDYEGQVKEIKAYGMLARCILHEIDHTRGVVIADYLSPLRKKMALKRFEKRSKLVTRLNK